MALPQIQWMWLPAIPLFFLFVHNVSKKAWRTLRMAPRKL